MTEPGTPPAPQSPDNPDKFDELLAPSPREKDRRLTFKLRITGFALIVAAFVTLMAWRNGTLASPVYRKASIVLGGLGVLLYFGARAVEITRQLRNRKPE